MFGSIIFQNIKRQNMETAGQKKQDKRTRDNLT